MPGPEGTLDSRYSSPGAQPVPWQRAVDVLETAEVFWLTTVRRDGRPHTTPLLAIWLDDCLFFSTGSDEQKARNLEVNSQCSLTTGINTLMSGYDVVVEGTAEIERTPWTLDQLVVRYQEKYGWTYTVQGDRIVGDHENVATVYRVSPSVVYGFGKGEPFTHMRWRI